MPTVKQLKYFSKLAHNASMNKLAEQCFVSQTAISNALSRLEEEIGVQLFDRIRNRLVLNQYGEAYLRHVDIALEALKNGFTVLSNMQEVQHGETISLALPASLLWQNAIVHFLKKNPIYRISQKEYSLEQIANFFPSLDVELIIAGEMDLPHTFLEYRIFAEDRLYLFASPTHHLAHRDSVTLDDLRNEAFIDQPSATGFSRFCRSLFANIGVTPNIVAECDYTLRHELLCQGMGIVLASDSTLRAGYYADFKSIPIEDACAIRKMAVFWSKTGKLSRAAQQFRDFLIEYYHSPD